MSELITSDWAAPEQMAYWRDEVRKRAEARLAECPTAKQALEIKDPEKAAEALYLLTEGKLTKRAICDSLGIANQELWRLERHHAGTLAAFFDKKKPELAARYIQLAESMADVLQEKITALLDNPEELSKTGIEKVAIALGVVNDKALNLGGIATVKIEHVKGASIEDAMRAIEEAKARVAGQLREGAIEAEIVA